MGVLGYDEWLQDYPEDPDEDEDEDFDIVTAVRQCMDSDSEDVRELPCGCIECMECFAQQSACIPRHISHREVMTECP